MGVIPVRVLELALLLFVSAGKNRRIIYLAAKELGGCVDFINVD